MMSKLIVFLKHGALKIKLTQYIERADQMLAEACKSYQEHLDEILAAPEGTFQNSEFRLLTNGISICDKEFGRFGNPQGLSFIFSKIKGSEESDRYFGNRKNEREKLMLLLQEELSMLSSPTLFFLTRCQGLL